MDGIWKAFWTGGLSNPLELIEQIAYLLVLRRLDELQELVRTVGPKRFRDAVRLCAGLAHSFYHGAASS